MSTDFAEILIAEVSKRRCLWDIREKSFYNRVICDQEWAAVANAVGSTKGEAKNKWKSLRNGFRRELKKKPITSSGDAANAWSSKWCYFQALMFLKDIMTPRETGTNVALECQQSLSSNGDSDTEVPEIGLGEKVFDGHVDCVLTEEFLPSTEDHNSMVATSPPPPSLTGTAKRRQSASFERELLEMESQKIKILKSQAKCEDRKFLLSLVPYFKQIEPLEKLEVMGQIIDVLRSKISNKK
ncbi:uncharacterized protein LOC126248469 [Schistocerca nitens]|uniref:uncharacterized protein LOC126248469 n=1 Tax=Schistocerca nitens TaxID=7011 RepID=UPI002119160C|nr:uncharacterized protein LOC126248469 [Schistocerca nitens]